MADLGQYVTLHTAKLTANLQAVAPGALFFPDILAAAASGTLSFVEGTALGGRLAGTPGSDLFVVEQPNAVLTGLGRGDEFVVGRHGRGRDQRGRQHGQRAQRAAARWLRAGLSA